MAYQSPIFDHEKCDYDPCEYHVKKENKLTTKIIKCVFCGDSCGEEVCYSCQDTADDMGIDIEGVMF